MYILGNEVEKICRLSIGPTLDTLPVILGVDFMQFYKIYFDKEGNRIALEQVGRG